MDEKIQNEEIPTKYPYPSLSTVILQSLMLLGPILWLIFNYFEERWEALKYNIPIAIISFIILIVLWRNYIIKSRKNKSYQRSRNKGGILLLPLLIFVIIASLASFVLLNSLQVLLFKVDDWLFYQMPDFNGLILIAIVEYPLIAFVLTKLFKRYKNSEWKWAYEFTVLLKKYWIYSLVVWVILLYISLTGITFVTEDKVIYRSWLKPQGITYEYSDVDEIKTGYSGKLISFSQKKGTFYYKVSFKGRWITFGTTSPNESIERYNDSYLELEEFDEKLMKYSPKKISSRDNEEHALLDDRYIQRFGRIIENK
ncbi:hypothetical protein ACPWSR_08085 [Alloiococcus sp. CFN-8]|uniref:hypothetical protein n=1 Tax=Alloiococcus sp. CFN-8 TaxID=3416081 RepID=UPI003CF2039D